MPPSLSKRISLRRLPDPPSEPTDTLVMNVGNHFLDLRVLKADTSIDWAFAGERIVLSENPLKLKWIHAIDSRNDFEPDEGLFTKLPNGDDLETGESPLAERGGAMIPYEEVWRDVPIPAGPTKRAWILRSVEATGTGKEAGTTFLGKAGGVFMGFWGREDGGFAIRREEWDAEGEKWSVKYAVGEGAEAVPSPGTAGEVGFVGEEEWMVDHLVEVAGKKFRVLAFEQLA